MAKITFQSVSDEEAERLIASRLRIPIEKVKRVCELVEVVEVDKDKESAFGTKIRGFKGVREAMKETGLTPRKIVNILYYF